MVDFYLLFLHPTITSFERPKIKKAIFFFRLVSSASIAQFCAGLPRNRPK